MPILQPLYFFRHTRQLRAFVLDGQPWFVARDLGRLINHPLERNPNRSLDADQLRTEQVFDARGEVEEALLISESGAYVVLLNCFHPENRCVRQWLSATVVPALRAAQNPQDEQPYREHWSWAGGQLETLQWQGCTWVPFAELPRLLQLSGQRLR